jgi:membrane-associated phospholipid phosphatase
MTAMRTSLALAAVLACASTARAEPVLAPKTGAGLDAAVAGGALLGVGATHFIPSALDFGDGVILGGLDRRVRRNFSATAAATSDALLITSLVLPPAVLIGDSLDRDDGRRLLVYGEAFAINALLASGAKHLVARRRPYTYADDPGIKAWAATQGEDAHRSFYSGHSALSFGAAVTGAYLYSARSGDRSARALVWGVQLAVATATANLRVRAGRHYYSDVLIGAVVGTGVGLTVAALRGPDGAFHPTGTDVAAMAGGVVVGALASQLLPVGRTVLAPAGSSSGGVTAQLIPLVLEHGSGLAAVGAF